MTLSKHTEVRMQQRRVSTDDIDKAFAYGRAIFQGTGSMIFIIGRREIKRHQDDVDLTGLNGLHVVCNARHVVITTYRNKSFKEKNAIPSCRRRSKGSHRCHVQQLQIPRAA